MAKKDEQAEMENHRSWNRHSWREETEIMMGGTVS